MLDLINAGTKRLHHLINRVILMVQIESGHLQRMMESHCLDINLNELMLTVLSDFDFEKRNVVVQAQFTDDTQPIRGVSNYLKSALFELVDNAVKYSNPEGTIYISTKYMQDKAHITIRDEGIGIASNKLDHVWERFVQINRSTQEQQGIGLGLALVQSIVSAHNGKCTITSTVKQGTEITLFFPLAGLDNFPDASE
jgi:signal transduction histidine kinase